MRDVDVYYQSMLQKTHAKHDVARPLEGKVSWAQWRKDLRGDFLACLGGWPEQVPLSMERGEVTQKDGYTRERITFYSEQGLRMPAYLLTPTNANKDTPTNATKDTPTAIALPGHGFGVADIVGLDHRGEEQSGEPSYQYGFAVDLCRHGFVVIAPELLGFGELRLERDDHETNQGVSSCLSISAMLLMVGRTMAGARVQQARTCIDVLETLGYTAPPVAMGISGGGLVCAYLAALEDRVRGVCISGFANTYRGSILAMHHCVDNFQPDLLNMVEMTDVLSAICPRPMLWEAGESDPIFPIEHVEKAYETVEKVYKAQGALERFALDRFSGEHQIHGKVAYDFLAQHKE